MTDEARTEEPEFETRAEAENAAEDDRGEPAEAEPPASGKFPKGMGWKKDAHDPRDYSAAALFGAPVNLPKEALDLPSFVLRINDQGPTSSCVGQAITKAIHVRLRKIRPAGAPEPLEPSAACAYVFARRRTLQNPKAPLYDDGAMPRDAMTMIRDVGVGTEASFPFNPATINADPPWDVVQEATKYRVFEWYRVYESGASRSAALANALAKGFPVVFGMDLWKAFFDYSGGTIEEAGADSAGGHMLCILGYRTRADGRREFLVINSWGAAWGVGGYFWILEDVLALDRASDFYAIQVAA